MKVLSSRCEKALRLDDPVDLKNLRVFYWDNAESFCGVRATTSEIRRKVHKVTSYFSKKGAPVEQVIMLFEISNSNCGIEIQLFTFAVLNCEMQ